MTPGPPHDDAWWAGFCEVMELTRSSCAHCRKLPDVPALDLDEQSRGPELQNDPGPPFVARFDGFCRECGHSIAPGDTIRGAGTGYVHEGCTDVDA